MGEYLTRLKCGTSKAAMVAKIANWICFCAVLFIIVVIVKMEYDSAAAEADKLSSLLKLKDNGTPAPEYDDNIAEEEMLEFASAPKIFGHSVIEIYEKIYKPNGFFVDSVSQPFLTLKRRERPNCERPFQEYAARFADTRGNFDINITNTNESANPALDMFGFALRKTDVIRIPKKIDAERSVDFSRLYNFTLDRGNSPVKDWITKETGFASVALHNALLKNPIYGQEGIVIGSNYEVPWVENFAMKHGAARLTVVEKRKILWNDARLQYITPLQVAENYESHLNRYSFAISIGHLGAKGLGSDEEPVDASADVKEVLKIACMLKKGAHFFLSERVGRDSLIYSTARVYGRIRIPMLLVGFEIVDVFLNAHPNSLTLKSKWIDIDHKRAQHPVIILRKK